MQTSTNKIMQTMEEKFSQIFKYMGIPKEKITMEASFAGDFGFNDFQFTCLAFYIGIYFKINIRDGDYAELNTVGNTIDFVRKKLDKRRYEDKSHLCSDKLNR